MGGGGECTKMTGGGSKTCTGIDFARCRRSGGCSGAPGGSREGAGSSPEGLRRSFRVQNGSKRERSRPGLRLQRDAPSPKRRASSVTTDLSCPTSSIGSKVLRFARRTMNLGSKTLRIPAWRPFFLRSPFLSWGVGACGRRPLQSADPQVRRAGRWSKQGGRKLRKQYRGGDGLGFPCGGGGKPCTDEMQGILHVADVSGQGRRTGDPGSL